MNGQENRAEPPLSVVIPSRSRADLLCQCLTSVREHAPVGTEVIVVDDASQRGVISQIAREFTSVRVLRTEKSRGFSAAVNLGIRHARAAIVEVLNDDTEVEHGWADAVLRLFHERPQVVAIAPLVIRFDSTCALPRIDSAGDRYHLGGFAQKRGNGALLADRPLQTEEVFGASGSSAFFRRDALERIGFFPESFGSYFEDVDVSFRLRRMGGKILFVPESRVWHHVHASFGRPDRRLLEQQSRNEELVFWRNMPARLLPQAIPWHLAVLAAKGLRRWREGKLLSFLVGRLRAFSEFASVLRHRKSLCTGDVDSLLLDRGLPRPG